MNKKEISMLKKEFKSETDVLRIREIMTSYCKQEKKQIVFSEMNYFDNLDETAKEIYNDNFKKVLSGNIDSNLFELDFENHDEGEASKQRMYKLLKTSDFKNEAIDLTKDVIEHYNFDSDVCITVIRAEYYKTLKRKNTKKSMNELDELDEKSISFEFLICSINKLEKNKKSLKLDYENRKLQSNSNLDLNINFKKPLQGFMFPILTDGYVDVNKILYHTSDSNNINEDIVNDVMKCYIPKTAKEEKEIFDEILKSSIGDETKPELIHSIYSEIKNCSNENQINSKDIANILKNVGIEKVDCVIEKIIGDKNITLKPNNIIPNGRKSVKINGERVNIAINPENLDSIKQINQNGKKCLLIELDETVEIQGFKLKTEK